MKPRIKTDVALLIGLVILTMPFFFLRTPFSSNVFWDNVFDVIGIILILKGNLIRMAARSHKKKNSRQGVALVMTGLYSVVRNPMYLGTFLVGSGFVLLLWPFWILPVFAAAFYLRFNAQMRREEEFLKSNFGQIYEDYCQKTPRLFPSLQNIFRLESKQFLNLKEALHTKEKWSLLAWLALAFILEIIQEKLVFQSSIIFDVLMVFLAAIILYGILLRIKYRAG